MLLIRIMIGLVVALGVSGSLAWAQDGPSAKLKIVRGGAGVLKGDGTPISPAYSGLAIGPGDQVGTFSRSDARIDFTDGSTTELGSETTVVFRQFDVVNGRLNVVADQSSGVVRHRVDAATYQNGGYRILLGEYIVLVAPSNVARRVTGGHEPELARLPIDPAVALNLGASARRSMNEGGDIVTFGTTGGSNVILVFDGESHYTRKESDDWGGVSYVDVPLRRGQGMFYDQYGLPHPFGFDPNAAPAAIEAQVQDLLDEAFEGSGVGRQIAVRDDPRRRFGEKKEDKPKQNEPANNNGGGNQGGNQLQVLVAAVQQTTQEPVAGTDVQEILLALNQPSNQAVTVVFEFQNGTATNGDDFGAPVGPQSVTFNPGQTQKSIFFNIKSDAVTEGPENFQVAFSTSPNAKLGSGFPPNGKLTFTINNNP